MSRPTGQDDVARLIADGRLQRVSASPDAARKSLAALLQAQGLRATTRGGHYAVEQPSAPSSAHPRCRRRSGPSDA